ncbi:putative enoyl-CoA hydratase/isomerase [Mycobacteroides abscessus subsp. bolletii 1S-154-0310]|nr:putative enoyl-CoA hydratase/isomerase [Mycobacteroides abscessus subsp. bolletii 1S-151-0930]EIU71838.1 putative enoyl-CoA hydratase/isomerase [Mycobacteroides abscessus subsp. bolletii 1S-153-0915]EIU72661.1 putative enoyl-CoA hydratase/isomerase [Mycobacteroides abscessus subsp. bolletii 1S-152-0914]EIU76274.1 putative enoyl-CoA hydratase/isomerase [Mycobacteroides abscessus subsp. bolletii 1S-154-0310]EIU85897.1 putative enoyl-CoA hydratase/isomerase [Mycobacteroides abscessus 5S-0921]E
MLLWDAQMTGMPAAEVAARETADHLRLMLAGCGRGSSTAVHRAGPVSSSSAVTCG